MSQVGFLYPNDVSDTNFRSGRTVFSSSIIWGAIGPARNYSIGNIYSGLLHFFWIGALCPLITWGIWKYWPTKSGAKRNWLRLVNWPLIFVGTYNVPPATGINYSSWALVNIIFNYWIKGRWFAWWCKLPRLTSKFTFTHIFHSKIQLCARCGAGYRIGTLGYCHFFLHLVSRRDYPYLVG